MLTQGRFDEPTVARRLGGRSLVGVPRLADGRKSMAGPVEDANAALIRLFIDNVPLPAVLLRDVLSDGGVAVLLTLGLVHAVTGEDGEELHPAAALYPTQDLWLASDVVPLTAPWETAPQDYVFGALNELTWQFLQVVPDAPGGHVLELCAGTGVAALRAVKRGAASAVAADLVPRCVHFAQFNAHLNGLADRVRVVQSDVWEALEGEQFDLVVAHPPYVAALSHRFDFRDAGVDGEHVTRRVVEGIPRHLRPGGRCVVRAALSDRRGATMGERLRSWLGDEAPEFDQLHVESTTYGPLDAYRSARRGQTGFEDCERWLTHFEELGIERFSVCLIEFRRDAAGRPPMVMRRVAGIVADRRAMDWHFAWEHFLASAGDTPLARVGSLAPRVVPGGRLLLRLEADAGRELRPVGARVETSWPSRSGVDVPALAPTLLQLCDGTRSTPDLLDGLRREGLVAEDVGVDDVAALVELLAAAAAVELPPCPVPTAPTLDLGSGSVTEA